MDDLNMMEENIICALKIAISKNAINNKIFSINEPKDDAYTIIKYNNEWMTYLYTEYKILNIKKFNNVYNASMDFINRISKNPEQEKNILIEFSKFIVRLDQRVEKDQRNI